MSHRAEALPSKTGWLRSKSKERPGDRTSRRRLLVGAAIPGIALIVWQLLGHFDLISRMLFPTPLTIADSFVSLIASGELWGHLRISLLRAAGGFALGGILGLLFGVLVGLLRSAEKALDPTVQMIRMIPHLAVAPLFVLWFGLGETSKILIIAKGAFFPIYINAFLGIRNVDNKLFDVAKVLSFSRFRQITRLVVPAAMPNLLLGVRLSLGVAWLGLVVAELMGSTSGIGYLMSDARQFSRTSVVFVCIIIFALVGYLVDVFVRLLERRLLQWRDSFQGK